MTTEEWLEVLDGRIEVAKKSVQVEVRVVYEEHERRPGALEERWRQSDRAWMNEHEDD